jgi:polycystin 1L2
MSQVNGFKGFVGFSIREMSLNEKDSYCTPNSSLKTLPLIQNKVNFSSDFRIRSYSSGCFYYDLNTGKWNSDGMEIYKDTNLRQTHCLTNHLTSFAGGLAILPTAINFQYVFANASFTQNPLIYLTSILVICIYILFALWAKCMDKRDLKKLNIIPLKDNNPYGDYFYELIVFTGDLYESGTQSKVMKFINLPF